MPERRIAAPATDQTIEPSPDPRPDTQQEKKSRFDLSLIQVMGGALAAMTAAALGSRFGVEGTVVGAALASVIAAVASALYTASLHRTGEAVRVVISGRRIPAAGIGRASAATPVHTGSTAVAPDSLLGPTGTSAKANRRRVLVVSSVVGALATFGLAAGAVTMYETLTGQALSGGSGTTFSQVQQTEPEDRPADEPTPASSDSVEPSSTAEPSAEASVTPQAEPSPTAEPSAESSAESSPEPSITPEADPSATAAPPSAAESQTDQTPR